MFGIFINVTSIAHSCLHSFYSVILNLSLLDLIHSIHCAHCYIFHIHHYTLCLVCIVHSVCLLWMGSLIHLSEPVLSNNWFQRTDSVILLRHCCSISAFQKQCNYYYFNLYCIFLFTVMYNYFNKKRTGL